jgi:pyruvate/2-oxoglutarate/acetoin dehydrogenase E1 component
MLATALAVTPFAANAQDAGVTVYSQVDDSEVGTIASNDGTNAVLDTGTYKVPLGTGTFAEREGKWTINATKAQINSMMAAAEAEAAKKLAAALVDGAAVMSADNMPVGTVLAMDETGDQVIVSNDTGIISLKREHFAVGQTGGLTALFTAEQLAGYTTEVPEGAVVETPEGQMMRTADGWEATEMEAGGTASAAGATGASE